ncbi:MAG: hypothetical protein AAGM22_21715 [Acidobacteriota bacterium]
MDDKAVHLQMIQGVISRMAGNSFLIKGWSITLVSALFALADPKTNPHFFWITYFPVFAFLCLDVYFLHRENLFRKLYELTAALEPEAIDFSMDVGRFSDSASWLQAIGSPPLILFHVCVIGTVVTAMVMVF